MCTAPPSGYNGQAMPTPIPPKYLDDARTILRFLRDRFAKDDAFNRQRWGQALSLTFGYGRPDIVSGTGLRDQRIYAVLRHLLRLGLIRISSKEEATSSYRQGVAGGGAGNFRSREVTTSYIDTRYRITDAGEVFIREPQEERMPAPRASRVVLPKLEHYRLAIEGAFEDEDRALVDWFEAACTPEGASLDQGRIAQVIRLLQEDRQAMEDINAKEMKKPIKDPFGHFYNERDVDSIKSNKGAIKDYNVWLRKLEKYQAAGPQEERMPAPRAFEDRVGEIAEAVQHADALHDVLAADPELAKPARLARTLLDTLRNAESCETHEDFEANLLQARTAAFALPDLLKAARKGAEPNTLEALGDAKDHLRDLVSELGEVRQDRLPVMGLPPVVQGVPQTVKFGDTTLGFVLMEAEGETYINLYSVRTPAPKRGQGAARAALGAFLAVMDAQGVPVGLAASPLDQKTNRAKLVRFYESLGFQRTGKTINPAGDPILERPVGGSAHEERMPVSGPEDDDDFDVESSYEDEGMVGRHWGSSGAGILFTTGAKVLVLLRSEEVNAPGVWAPPGGAVPVDEDGDRADPFESALGETREETGFKGKGELLGSVVWKDPNSDFTYETFVVRVGEFEPRLNWENDEGAWLDLEGLQGLDLHPAFAEVLPDLAALAFEDAEAVDRLSTTWADVEGEESPVPVTIEVKSHPSGFRVYAWATPPTGDRVRIGNLTIRRIDEEWLTTSAGPRDTEQDCTRDIAALRQKYPTLTEDLYSVREAFVEDEHQGDGVGAAMYTAAVEEAGRRNGLLIANACEEGGETSKAARRAWRSKRLQAVAEVRGIVAAHRGTGGAKPQEKVDRMPWTSAEIGIIAVDMAIPDPVPGIPGPLSAGVLARHSLLPVFSTERDPPKNEYHWLELDQITPALPLMHKRKVSEVARGHGGFLHAYRQEDGERDDMALGWWWRRHNFLKRHLAQVKKRGEPLWDAKGEPTRRALALVAWAYHPEPKRWATWLRRQGGAVDRLPVKGLVDRLPVKGTPTPRQAAMNRFWDAFEEIAGKEQVIFVGPFQLVGDRKGGILAKLEVSSSIEEVDGKPAVHLGYIGVNRENRKKGYGRRVMQMLVQAADRAGLGMDLDIDPQAEHGDKKPPMNAKQLGEFYATFGFKKVKGLGPKYMRRSPGAPGQAHEEAHEERLATVVVRDPTLYHGTAFRNLPGILREGYHPGKGYSPHQTKTRTATFLTDDMQAAIGYSTAGDTVPVAVLEFNVAGLPLEPDYDDAADLISADLMQLQSDLDLSLVEWQAALGETIPEEVLAEVEDAIAHLENQEERAAPFTLEIDTDPKGRSYLYAQPYVKMQIAGGDEYAHDEFVLDANDLVWEDGVPFYQAKQFLVRSGISLDRLVAVWLEGEGGRRFTDYGSLEEDEDEGTRDFRKVSLVRLTPDEARARLASK